MSIESRLSRLEKSSALVPYGACPACAPDPRGVARTVARYRPSAGEPEPVAPPCGHCGHPRQDVLVIEERVVATREEAAPAMEEVRRAAGGHDA